MRSIFVCAFGLFFLMGCQSASQVKQELQPILYDGLYPDYAQIELETEDEIFALDDRVKSFLKAKLSRNDSARDKVHTLVSSIFDHSDLHLLYENSANTIAVDTFQNKAANCLSLSILTYAMAEYAGLDVTFQEVFIPEFWTMRNGFSLRNGHINLVIYPQEKVHREVVYGPKKGVEVDFDRTIRKKKLPKKQIGKKRVVAMFYNNKGADALVNGDMVRAYAYFRQAVLLEPNFGAAWVNLGIIYRRGGYLPLAEQSYQQALVINDDDTTAMENLAYVYELSERGVKAQQIRNILKRKRLSNPNYHFILGEQAYFRDDWHQAIGHYRAAIRLDKRKHEFYFAVSKAYYQLGDINRSQDYLKRAKKIAKEDSIEARYQGKLNMLSRL